ncbi:MAG TPA: amidohydrolase family protein [Phycisphaerae bacterium]|nr:amidohydrolase family protein [Phycisphaerae bacterium]
MNRSLVGHSKVLVSLLAAALLPAVTVAQTSAGRVVHAAAYVGADGKIHTGGVVVVENGVITQVGGDVPSDTRVDAYPGGVVCPGLIDCAASLGAYGNLSERQNAIQPHVNARDAFDRFSRQLRAALAAGVTTFALAPDDQNLVGGRIAVCQTAGPDGKPRILTEAGPLKLSIAPESFKQDREPTSRAGAIGLLRETIEAARRDASEDNPLAAFAAGRLTGVFTTPSGADVLAALRLKADYGLRLVLVHTRDARLVAEQTAGQVTGVIVGPLDLAAGRREALAAGVFERHAVPVALAGGLPARPADSLRIAAAVAARAGLTPEAARRAITTVPADLLGMGDRIGKIQKGHQADLVVFSGDPLDLRSRVLAVYVAGQRVYVPDLKAPEGDQP